MTSSSPSSSPSSPPLPHSPPTTSSPVPSTSLFYKIMSSPEYLSFSSTSPFIGSPLDHSSGFIHFSYLPQLSATLSRYYLNRKDIYIAEFSPDRFSHHTTLLTDDPVESRNGELFPHYYCFDVKFEWMVRGWKIEEVDEKGVPMLPKELRGEEAKEGEKKKEEK